MVYMSNSTFPCPKCKGYTYVYHGKKVPEKAAYRRYRKCSACGYTYQTLEVFDREDARRKDYKG